MTRYNDTIRTLSEITDTGLFENLATAVLRNAKPELYGNLTQPGVNADGKTVKSPVDGISFVPGANPRHMVTTHHTIGLRKDLQAKWLHDPCTVMLRKRSMKPAAPAGDLVKTIAIASDERRKTSNLKVTLALTTNKEPPENVTREVERTAHEHGIVLDIWACSRIANYLDHTPDGQWLRKKYLGIEQERLSHDLLRELSRKSLEIQQPRFQISNQVVRDTAQSIIEDLAAPIGFLVGESGFGKSVACYQHLARNIELGACGVVLPHDVLASSVTLDQALDSALRQLHPTLAPGSGAEARSLCSLDSPLRIVVEDVSRSGQSAHLIERLARWAANQRKDGQVCSTDWRLICPVWPELFAALDDETRKQVEPLSARLGPFSLEEARQAIFKRAASEAVHVSSLDADVLTERLGYDPLLIGLSDLKNDTPPEKIIAAFIAGSTSRLAGSAGTHSGCDYALGLRLLANEILRRRTIAPAWGDVRMWFKDSSDQLATLRELAKHGEIIRVTGFSDDARLEFRHDRVRMWLLTDAAAHALREQSLDEAVFSEPFFADVIGAALADPSTPPSASERARLSNPLALFYALHSFRETSEPVHHATLSAIDGWLADDASHSRAYQSVRYAALHILSDTQSSHVVSLLDRFRDRTWTGLLAGLRNGDLKSGVDLCYSLEPGTSAGWRDHAIEHAKARFAPQLVIELSGFLKRARLTKRESIGALRLAGHLGDTSLADAIWTRWTSDTEKTEHLDDYLWAAAQCGGERTDQLLLPVCDAWAALPNKAEEVGRASPRDNLAADHVAWAFWKRLPEPALRYFINRASHEDLRWPITYMLRGVDHPDAVAFLASELATRARVQDNSNGYSPFFSLAQEHWRRRQQESRKPMSQESRARLLGFWVNPDNDKHLRKQSFLLWATTSHPDDLSILRNQDPNDLLEANVLRARLERGDKMAIPRLIEKIHTDDKCNWWQSARDIWSDDLTATLDEHLTLRGATTTPAWSDHGNCDWIISNLVTRLAPPVAEQLLNKHWSHLRFSPRFVQAALYTATPRLLVQVGETVRECPSPSTLFEHIASHFGIKIAGHPGVTRIEQVEALIPYLNHIGEHAIYDFWELCNERGWTKLRRDHFDSRLVGMWRANASLDDNALFADLDRKLTYDRVPWLDSWVKRHMNNGRSIESILNIVRQWLASNRTTKALEIAASIIVHAGTRTHIDLLSEESDQPELAKEIIADTRFAVFRRTLN